MQNYKRIIKDYKRSISIRVTICSGAAAKQPLYTKYGMDDKQLIHISYITGILQRPFKECF